MKVVHHNLLLPFGGNVKDSKDDESWQDVDESSDCIQAVFDDVEAEPKDVLTDPEPEDKGDTMHIQCKQTVYEISW